MEGDSTPSYNLGATTKLRLYAAQIREKHLVSEIVRRTMGMLLGHPQVNSGQSPGTNAEAEATKKITQSLER